MSSVFALWRVLIGRSGSEAFFDSVLRAAYYANTTASLHPQSPFWQMIVDSIPHPLPSLMLTLGLLPMFLHTHPCVTDGPVKPMIMYTYIHWDILIVQCV